MRIQKAKGKRNYMAQVANSLIDSLASQMSPESAALLRKTVGQEETLVDFTEETVKEPGVIEHTQLGQLQEIRAEGKFKLKGFALRSLDVTKQFVLRWEVVTDPQGCQVLVCYKRRAPMTLKGGGASPDGN